MVFFYPISIKIQDSSAKSMIYAETLKTTTYCALKNLVYQTLYDFPLQCLGIGIILPKVAQSF